jgi:hypothetical protein
MTTRLGALASAIRNLEEDTKDFRGAEVYCVDHGRNYQYPSGRYEAGVLKGMGSFGFRTNAVGAPSWAELVEKLEAIPAKRRRDSHPSWANAAFDALTAGTDPAVVAAACQQLNEWFVNGSEA